MKRPQREPAAPAQSSMRKPSHTLRKEEREQLAEQVRALEDELDALRSRAGLPTREDHREVRTVEGQNADLRNRLVVNDLHLGRAHSMVTHELLIPVVNPMSTFIHLPSDMKQRRDILRDIQDLKLRRGVEVATQRLRHLDHTIPYLSEERFSTPTGEYHCHRQEINQFPNFKSARQLFDTFVNFLYNLEISVTEGLGQLTLREDAEEIAEPTIWNHRFVTVVDNVGCTEELNNVGFARFYNFSTATNSPMGIVVVDTVNVDDLYPYVPEARTCKDVQAVHMMFEIRKPGTDETVVVLKQFLFCVQLPPQFELEPRALKQLQANTTRWSAYLVKYLRDFVVAPGSC